MLIVCVCMRVCVCMCVCVCVCVCVFIQVQKDYLGLCIYKFNQNVVTLLCQVQCRETRQGGASSLWTQPPPHPQPHTQMHVFSHSAAKSVCVCVCVCGGYQVVMQRLKISYVSLSPIMLVAGLSRDVIKSCIPFVLCMHLINTMTINNT